MIFSETSNIIFLIFICLIIAALVYRIAPARFKISIFVLLMALIWLVYNHTEKNNKEIIYTIKETEDELDSKLSELSVELGNLTNENVKAEQSNEKIPEIQHKNEIDISMFKMTKEDVDRDIMLKTLYKDMGCSGDNKIANRMKFMGMQPKLSQDIRSRMNVEKFRHLFEEELHENEVSEWWQENPELDALM